MKLSNENLKRIVRETIAQVLQEEEATPQQVQDLRNEGMKLAEYALAIAIDAASISKEDFDTPETVESYEDMKGDIQEAIDLVDQAHDAMISDAPNYEEMIAGSRQKARENVEMLLGL